MRTATIAIAALTADAARAQHACHPTDLSHAGSGFIQIFANTIAVDGDTAVVGAPGDDPSLDTNAAFIFTRSGDHWYQSAELQINDGNPYDALGIDADIDTTAGTTRVILGAADDEFYTGAAYIFRLDGLGWTLETRLDLVDRTPGDRFGFAVAIEGETAVVTASHRDVEGSTDAGAIYIYELADTGWHLAQTITRNVPNAGALFGYAIDLDGDHLIVGEPFDCADTELEDGDFDTICNGLAHIYRRGNNSWFLRDTLTAPDHDCDTLGFSVAIDGSTAAVGAHRYDGPAGTNQGAALIFKGDDDDWFLDRVLTAPGPTAAPGANMGVSIDLAGDTLAVGVPSLETPGAALIYSRADQEWTHTATVGSPIGHTQDSFGFALAIADDALLVGARFNDAPPHTTDAPGGAAHAFPLNTFLCCPGDCDNNGTINISDILALLDRLGQPGNTGCTLDDDPTVTFNDIILALNAFGPCN